MVNCGLFWSISLLSTVAVTHPHSQPQGRQLWMCPWSTQLAHSLQIPGGQKGSFSTYTGECVLWQLMAASDPRQTKRWAIVVAPAVLKAQMPSVEIMARRFKKPIHLSSLHFSPFPPLVARHWRNGMQKQLHIQGGEKKHFKFLIKSMDGVNSDPPKSKDCT